jgi:hypothetical protein
VYLAALDDGWQQMSLEWADKDRRDSIRHEFRLSCRIRATLENGQAWAEDTWTTDVSAYGACILSSIGKVPVGTVEVTLTVPQDLRHVFAFDTVTRRARIIEAEVRSKTLEVVGLHIEFDESIPVVLM